MDTTADPRPLYLRALGQLEKLAAAVTPEMLERPTPCSAYDLRALLGHTVGGVHRSAYTGEGGRGMDVATAVGAVADDDWVGAFGRARERWAAAWREDAALERVVEVPWGRVPGRLAVGGYLMEAVTHSWDIAQVVDPEAALDEELAHVVLGTARQVLPAEGRGEGVPFGQAQPVPDDAGVYARMAAWLGRSV
ncbi:TIGR03086 family metal-binding protein [Kitasatospora sp. NPDC051914]|uniref:TIGR03086 family metal-binding protein n=1 Tax=Kitasatospora sp. NPDC051914 TaxID=3154945 RepID=UPI00342E9EC9